MRALVVVAILLVARPAHGDGEVRIDGYLQDAETFEPIGGAEVAAAGVRTVSDDEGGFVLDGVPAGDVEVHVTVPGRAPGSMQHRPGRCGLGEPSCPAPNRRPRRPTPSRSRAILVP